MSNAASEPSEIVGTILNKKYQVLERLSQGGMGVVYKARHLTLDTLVALKVLLKPEEEEAQERFLSEARLASKIRHPNTVYIADFGVLDDGRAFLEMEFLAGRTLAVELHKGPIDPLRACHIAMQIARGLQAVHEKGVIHRDLKPDNVFLLEQDGTADFVKIVDFGIAKVARRNDTPDSGKRAQGGQDSAAAPTAAPTAAPSKPAQSKAVDGFTQSGSVMGTPGYMAPEQISGEKLDVRVDQYALGCMLFEMLAGEPMFDAPTNMALMAKHLTIPPTSLRQKYPKAGVSKNLDALVLRLMSKEPGQRLRSMREVEAALQEESNAILRSRGQRARFSIDGLTRMQPSPRHPLRFVAVAAVGLLCMGLLATVLYRTLRGPLESSGIKSRELAALRERALAILRADLASGPAELRASAVMALGQSHDESLRPELEAALRSDVVALRAQAALALGTLGDRRAVPALAATLERPAGTASEQPQVLVAVANALRQLGDARGQRYLEQTLGSHEQETQFRAALTFCEQGPPDAQRVLRSYSQREGLPDATRLGILACLARVGDATALTRLHSLLADAGPFEVRLMAAAKLAQLGETEGLRFLREQQKKRGREQLLAAHELALLDERDGLDLFRQIVSNRDAQTSTRELSARGLSALGEASDTRPLGDVLSERRDPALTQAAAAAIVQITARDPGLLSVQSLAWARSALGDSDAALRQSAADILGDTLGTGAVSLLSAMMKDSDARVRRSVVAALGKQQDAAASLILRDALRDADRSVRSEALRALLRMADQAAKPGAIPSINQLLTQLSEPLRKQTEQGSPQEKALSASVLLRLGDESQRQRLRGWLKEADAELRRAALENLPAGALSATDLVALLEDKSDSVRGLAARRLAVLGDRRALPVLRELARGSTAEALAAAALAHRLAPDEAADDASEPVRRALQDANPAKRLEAIALLGSLPTASAKPLLLQAVRDRDPLVRRMVVAALSDLAEAEPAQVGELLPLAKRLASDSDADVRARGAALYSRLVQLAAAATKTTTSRQLSIAGSSEKQGSGPSSEASSEKVAAAGQGPADAGSPTAAATASTGLLVVEGPVGVQFAVDKRPWQAVSEKPIALEAGPHTLNFLSGEKPVEVVAGQTTRIKIPISQVEQLSRAGLDSFARSDFKKALRQMEKAVGLCSRDRGRVVACASLTFELYFRLGQIHEQQKEWPEAMAEYQRVLALASQVRGRADLKSGAQEAVGRLSPRLGQVVVPKRSKRGCSEDTIWLRPGTHSIKVDSKFEQIEVKAREVVRIGRCQ